MNQQLPLRTDLKLRSIGGRFYSYRGLLLLVMFTLVLWLNLAFIKSLVMGAIFATVLYPLMEKFDLSRTTAKIPRLWRAAIVTLGFTLLILIPVALLLFAGVQSVLENLQNLNQADFSPSHMSISTMINDLGLGGVMERIYGVLPISEAQGRVYMTKAAAAAAAFGGDVLQGFVTSLPGVLLANFVLVLTLFFLLIDGPRMVHFIRHNSIFNRIQTDRLITMTVALCNSVIVATLISGSVQASIVALICFFTGTAGLLFFAFVTFVSSFFPIVGTAPVVLFLSLQAFARGDTTHGIVWLLAIPVVGTSDNVVRPYVLKGGAELHPLIGFVAAFGALDMIGFYGLFIGPIVAGLFFTLLPMVTQTSPPRTPAVVR